MKHDTNRAGKPALRIFAAFILLIGAMALTSCETTSASSGRGGAGQLPSAAYNSSAVQARNAQIANEPTGNYYIGRRYWTDGTRFWGYVRKPRQPWTEAKLVIMNEAVNKQPDRVPEEGSSLTHGYDHNYEYRIWGSYTGKTIYDPNSNFMVPEFRLSKYELISQNPGFLFYPGETYDPRRLPVKHPPLP